MIDDSMKSHRMIGMIQPKKSGELKKPDLYEVGCLGKITSFNETEDGRLFNNYKWCKIDLVLIKKLKQINFIESCKVDYQINFIEKEDLDNKIEKFTVKDLDKIFKDLKNLFEKKVLWLIGQALKNKIFLKP